VESEATRSNVRLAFFMHYLDADRPLRTPFGEVPLPAPSEGPVGFAKLNLPANLEIGATDPNWRTLRAKALDSTLTRDAEPQPGVADPWDPST